MDGLEEESKMMCLALMTGFAAFVGAKIALRHGGWRRRAWAGHCGGWRHGRYPDEDPEMGEGRWGGWHGGGGGMFLRAVMHRIGVHPDQEEAIRAAVNELRDSGSQLRGEGRRTRDEIADAFRKPSFDEVAMGELFARHDTVLEGLRKSLVGSLAKIHNILDERQRQRLGDLMAQGPRAFRGFGW
jgi:Spy/CpxP family protein refolding chaperone